MPDHDCDHDPYPDEDTAGYEYAGSGLKLPDGTYVRAGETVALPDHVARHIADLLAPIDAEDEADEDAESGESGEGSDAEADTPADEPDAGVCTTTLGSGEECGRDLPCQYHSDTEGDGDGAGDGAGDG